jgi:serine/threonine-protein kinase SRPK3
LRLTENDFLKVLGVPELEELARLDGKPLDNGLPNQLVKAAGWDEWIDEDDEDLRIIDLGESFLQGAEPETLAQPGCLQAPETIFTDSFDYRLDLWRAGCVVRKLRLDFREGY